MNGLASAARSWAWLFCCVAWAMLTGVTRAEAPPVPAEAATMGPITFAVIGDFGLDI